MTKPGPQLRPRLRPRERRAALQGGNEARAVGGKTGEVGGGRAAIPSPLQHGVEIPPAGPDMRPIASSRDCVEVHRSGGAKDVAGSGCGRKTFPGTSGSVAKQ